jgi:hypothetical protein
MDLSNKIILEGRKFAGDGNLLSEDFAYNQELHMANMICG